MKDNKKFELVAFYQAGVRPLNSIERNVLQAALEHMQEHLESAIETYIKSKGKKVVEALKEEMETCKKLQKALK